MKELATLYRGAQFYAHAAHNLAKGKTFFEDHEHFGELYAAYESAYDSLIERMIGLDLMANPAEEIGDITVDAAKEVYTKSEYSDNDACFRHLLKMEGEIVAQIEADNSLATLGTQNLLQGLADQSEARQYQIKQRLK